MIKTNLPIIPVFNYDVKMWGKKEVYFCFRANDGPRAKTLGYIRGVALRRSDHSRRFMKVNYLIRQPRNQVFGKNLVSEHRFNFLTTINLRFPKTEMHPEKSGLFQREDDFSQLVKFFTYDYLIIIAIFYRFDV